MDIKNNKESESKTSIGESENLLNDKSNENMPSLSQSKERIDPAITLSDSKPNTIGSKQGTIEEINPTRNLKKESSQSRK